jgi:hypothetical protein
MSAGVEPLVVIACGALAREIVALKRLNGWSSLAVECLPPELHNRPEQIPAAVQAAIRGARGRYERIFVAYADCGTGGRLDAMLASEGIERLPGAHCYEAYATAAAFAELSATEPGTFYLTDFLLRHFERLIIEGLGLDRHPQLLSQYFGNYRRLVYLAQSPDARARRAAQAAAARLGLAYGEQVTGYGDLRRALQDFAGTPIVAIPVAERATWPR